MRPRQLLYPALTTVLLVFALTATWEFVLEGVLAPRHAINESPLESWRYVLTATLVAAVAWVVSGLISLRIVTRHDQVKRDLEEKEALSKQAADMARLGHYIWNERAGRHDYCSEELAHLFGYALADYLPKYDDYEMVVADIHPKDRARYEAAWSGSMETHQPYDVEYRALTAKGGYRHFREQGRPVIEHGELVRWIGVIQDITETKQAEEALRRSEALSRQTERLARLGHWEWDEIEDRCVYASEELARLHGMPPEEFVARMQSTGQDLNLVHPDDRAHYDRAVREARERRSRYEVEFRAVRSDGQTFDARQVSEPTLGADGEIVRWVGSVQDITDSKQAEQALRQSNEQLRVITDNVPALISYVDRDLRFRFANAVYAEWFGIPFDQIQGRHLKDVLGEPRVTQMEGCYQAALSGQRIEYENEAEFQDGRRRTLSGVLIPDSDADGTVRGFFALVLDTTERRQAQEALRESEARLRAMMDHAPFEMSVKDKTGRYLLVNREYERNYARPREAFDGKTPLDLFDEAFAQVYATHDEEVMKRGGPVEIESTVPLEDGIHTFMSTKFPIRDAAGEIASIGSISIDITERKQAEEALRQAHGRLELRVEERTEALRQANHKLKLEVAERKLAENALRKREAQSRQAHEISQIGYWNLDPDTDRISVSRELALILRASEADLGDLTHETYLTRFVHPDDRGRVGAAVLDFTERGARFDLEYRVLVGDRKIRWVQEIGETICDEGGKLIAQAGTIQDITERKRAQERMADLAKFPDENPHPILRVSAEGLVLYANEAARGMEGFCSSPDEGELPEGLLEAVRRAARTKQRSEMEIDLGERIFAFAFNPVENESYINLYARDVTEQRRAGQALEEGKRVLEARVAELEEAQRKLERQGAELVQVAGDLKIARDQAEAANRAKSEFLAAMSHELRTPLNAIIGFSEIIKDEAFGPTGNDKYGGYAKDIHVSGQHLLSLINDILDLSKVESGAEELYEEEVEVAEVVRSVVRLVKQRAERGRVGLEVKLGDDLPLLHADARKVKQTLVNLLTNAIKFTDPGGEVTLKAWCREDSGFVFQVVDTGIGITPDDIPKALSQFGQIDSDLNRKYEGTGLGLPLTKSLVELHGGSLDLQSQVGVGTVVTVRFPASRIVRPPESQHAESVAG